MSNNPNLAEARAKALKSPKNGKRGTSKKTLQKEAALKYLIDSFLVDIEPISKKLISKAKAGDMMAIRELLDRAFGKTKESIDITSKGEQIKGFNYISPNEANNRANSKTTSGV